MDEQIIRAAAIELRAVIDRQLQALDQQTIHLTRDEALLALGLVDAAVELLDQAADQA
ncbi:hypothetical protein FHS52_001080 [Erythromicrobium ramosum]|uniref:Uncharacterized protein n=1 Tax=Erythrobacter ramosus TaxID=35811 RepID=A0A6I4UI97_9SPHN|nr:hypothetical protein [Erythrobacter ramosus]MBB3775137.1 hypothetical protein [Erythrobacter ramosus]MXP37235.1 hypothetical protein [Erythrobacter ramosus]